MLKTFFIFAFEIIIGSIIVYFSIELFLVYLLLVILVLNNRSRKLRRFYNASTEVKILAIVKKLGITEYELNQTMKDQLNKMTDEQRKSIEEDFKNLK